MLYTGTETERMGETVGASEETIRDAIRLCGRVIRSGYEYDSVDSVAASCFYLACSRHDEPISLPDIADVSRKSKDNVRSVASNLMSELGIQLEPTRAETYLEEGLDRFEFAEDLREECYELLDRGRERNRHSGLAPTTIAGAIIYAVSEKYQLGINQSDVADFANKTNVSIRNSYREFLELADDVPVDALPPQTTDDAIAKLDADFEWLPPVYAEEAAEILEHDDSNLNGSPAAIGGAAYLAVARDDGSDVDTETVANAVGVTAQTIRSHYREAKQYV